MDPSSPAYLLVGDIGGTNARFALAWTDDSGIVLADVQQYRTAEFARLEDALLAFLRGRQPRRAVLAVASAVAGDHIKITNNPWSFSVSALSQELGCAVELLNDFAAVSMALPGLRPQDLIGIGPDAQPDRRRERRCYAVVGPGTGLGVSGLVLDREGPTVIESEGGHLSFAPVDTLEIELLRILQARFGRVSVERLISGSGLVNVYEALCALEGRSPELVKPADVTARAAQGEAVFERVLELSAQLLGSFAGDVALAFGAWDGLYLHGGVAQKMLPWLQRGGFRERFEAKGRHAPIMARIPTRLIVHPHAGLFGAAVHGTRVGFPGTAPQ